MLGKQAKVLSQCDIKKLLEVARIGRFRARNRVMVLLAVRAGLRACELANLSWGMVLDANGNVAATLDVRDAISKRRRGRRVPVHPQLFRALHRLRTTSHVTGEHDRVLVSCRGGKLQPNSVVNWFVAACHSAQLDGCSSHSGRRTFITQAARNVHRAGASLRDVQLLAGHSSIETTQFYIEGNSTAQRKLVNTR